MANAALPGWLEALAAGDEPWLALVPDGRTLRALGDWLGRRLRPAKRRTRAALSIHALPFLAQDDHDRLLWSSHLNVVRGEDSFVRARTGAPAVVVAGIYRQDGRRTRQARSLACAGAGRAGGRAAGCARSAPAWNREADFAAHWPALRAALLALEVQAGRFAGRLAEGPELAAALVAFAQSKIE